MTPRHGRFTVAASLLLSAAMAWLPAACSLPGTKAAPSGRPPVEDSLPVAATPRPVEPARPTPEPEPVSASRGLPAANAWLLHRGAVSALGDLARVAATYPIVAVDADPQMNRATAAQIDALQAGGARVLGWISVGAVEASRPVWTKYATQVEAAAIGPREGRPGETWIDPGDPVMARVIVNELAKGAVAAGVDGFLLGDAELATHLPDAADGPCDSGCRQGLLEIVAQIRTIFPDMLIVVQGAPGDVLRLGTTKGQKAFAPQIDGVVGLNVYAPAYDENAERALTAWREMKLTVNGRPFFLGTADVVAGCAAPAVADAASRARAAGFAPAVGDAAGPARKPCPL